MRPSPRQFRTVVILSAVEGGLWVEYPESEPGVRAVVAAIDWSVLFVAPIVAHPPQVDKDRAIPDDVIDSDLILENVVSKVV
jgi:hypothetical protein